MIKLPKTYTANSIKEKCKAVEKCGIFCYGKQFCFIAIVLMISQYFRFVLKTIYDMLIHQ